MDKLTNYRLLSFDVYGTLIDWETGIIKALQILLDQQPNQQDDASRPSRTQILTIYHELEKQQQIKTPDMPYSNLLATVYPQFARKIGAKEGSSEDAKKFGDSVGSWPAFPDTVDALRRLSKHFKLVVLSNVDKESFGKTNAGPLDGVCFDRIITAQEIGSYKPDHRNFEYMLQTVRKEFGVEKSQVLQTAQSQFHDHHPANEMGIKSVWIVRSATMGNHEDEIYDWKFATLGDMADAVEKEGV